MQLGIPASICLRVRLSFNPHPAFWPDATSCTGRRRIILEVSFNPHPAFWPDATRVVSPGRITSRNHVSILIRPSGRMQPGEAGPRPSDYLGSFNPHPAFWPDATGVAIAANSVKRLLFQSSSGLLAGCNARCICNAQAFQNSRVSILIRPSGRMQQYQRGCLGRPAPVWPSGRMQPGGWAWPDVGVSILIRPSGRMQRC